MRHLGGVDGLRGLAALAVLVSHVGFWTGAITLDMAGGFLARGDAGVAIFFAISAYLLVGIRLDGLGDSPGRYAAKRFARIMPAYWLALIAVLAIGGAGVREGGWGDVLSHLVMTQGYTGSDYQAFSQAWSLTTEVTFYVLVPVIVWWLAGVRRLATVLALLAGAGIGVHALAHALPATGFSRALGLSVLGHAAWFAAGIAVAHWQRLGRPLPSVSTTACAAILVFVVASSPVAGPRGLEATTWWQAATKEALYAVLAALVLSMAIRPLPEQLTGAFRVLGDWSYALFLWHLVVLQVLYSVTGMPLFSGHFWWVLAVTLGFSIALSACSSALIEQPIIRWVRARGQAHATSG